MQGRFQTEKILGELAFDAALAGHSDTTYLGLLGRTIAANKKAGTMTEGAYAALETGIAAGKLGHEANIHLASGKVK